MYRCLALLPLAAASCSTAPLAEAPPPTRGETVGHICRDEQVENYVGRPADQDVGNDLLRLSDAKTLQWLHKGTITTMEYREDRLKVWLGLDNRIERVSCG